MGLSVLDSSSKTPRPYIFEGNVLLLLIERIYPGTIAFGESVKKPFGIKRRYVGGSTGRNDNWSHRFHGVSIIIQYMNFIGCHNNILKAIALIARVSGDYNRFCQFECICFFQTHTSGSDGL